MLLGGPDDQRNAVMSFHAGAGGTEAQDWVAMLARQYTRYAESKGFKVDVVDHLAGEEAGLKSITMTVGGDYAYGLLGAERGVHRLVRISPFDAAKRRHTSFASVDVYPEADEEIEIELRDEDLRVDTYRASGKGGQHVNKTSSAVRLTHLATGLVAQCQSERSQHKNRATALKMLRSRLARLEEEKREAQQAAKYDGMPKVGFGSQIRNYFLHPDQRVKDARTGHMVGSFHSVLDGNIQDFLDAYLRWRVRKR